MDGLPVGPQPPGPVSPPSTSFICVCLLGPTELRRVRVLAAGTGHGRVDAALERQGLQRRIRLTVPHYVALGDVLGHSDLIATVPERFAARVKEPFGLVTRDLPLQVEGLKRWTWPF